MKILYKKQVIGAGIIIKEREIMERESIYSQFKTVTLEKYKTARYEAISKVSQAILESGLVETIFLKGSIARNEDDDFSDVDMYAVVLPENEKDFLKNRIKYMTSYMPLIYYSESNFVCPQIVGVYENALHFDLYTVRISSIPQTDDIKVIYDKSGDLNSYKKEPLNIASSDVSDYFNMFTYSLLEFEAAYSRGDLIWATGLASRLTGYISMVLRYIYDEKNSQLGMKRLYKYLPEAYRDEFIDILNYLTPSSLEIGVKKLVSFAEKILLSLPFNIKNQINIDFFEMMKKRILNINIK